MSTREAAHGRYRGVARAINLLQTVNTVWEINMPTVSGHTSAHSLAKQVLGTNVNDTSGSKIGTIEDVILDKQSTASCSPWWRLRLLGMNEKNHPIPCPRWITIQMREPTWSASPRSSCSGAAGSIDELTRDDGMQTARPGPTIYYKAPRYWERKL